jgi:hypothetical protein
MDNDPYAFDPSDTIEERWNKKMVRKNIDNIKWIRQQNIYDEKLKRNRKYTEDEARELALQHNITSEMVKQGTTSGFNPSKAIGMKLDRLDPLGDKRTWGVRSSRDPRRYIGLTKKFEDEPETFIRPPPRYYFMDLDLQIINPYGVSSPPWEYKPFNGHKVFLEDGDKIPYIKQTLENTMVKPKLITDDLIEDYGNKPEDLHEISRILNASRYSSSRDTVERIVSNQIIEETDPDTGERFKVLPKGSIIPGINMYYLHYMKGNREIKREPLAIPYKRYDGTTFIDKVTGRSINDLVAHTIKRDMVQFINSDDAAKDIYRKLRLSRGPEQEKWIEYYGDRKLPSDFWGNKYPTNPKIPTRMFENQIELEERKRKQKRAKSIRDKPNKKSNNPKPKKVIKSKPKRSGLIKNYAIVGDNMISNALAMIGGHKKKVKRNG